MRIAAAQPSALETYSTPTLTTSSPLPPTRTPRDTRNHTQKHVDYKLVSCITYFGYKLPLTSCIGVSKHSYFVCACPNASHRSCAPALCTRTSAPPENVIKSHSTANLTVHLLTAEHVCWPEDVFWAYQSHCVAQTIPRKPLEADHARLLAQ